MNEDDESEYQAFYDYARTYENMNLPMDKAIKEEKKEGDGEGEGEGEVEGEDSWEDCDLVSGDEDEEEEEKKIDVSEVTIPEATSSAEKSSGIGGEVSSIAEDTPSVGSSHGFNLEEVLKRRKVKGGMTRAEAFKALQHDKAELLSTGEIKLASGKIIGHRDFKYIYNQRVRLPDEREAVIINKLALQYRVM